VITQTIKSLTEGGYLNDREFVFYFVQSRIRRGFGEKMILFELKKFRVDEEVIEGAFAELRKTINYKGTIKEIIEKKEHQYKGDNKKEKIFRYLAQRGFSYSDIIETLNEHFGMRR